MYKLTLKTTDNNAVRLQIENIAKDYGFVVMYENGFTLLKSDKGLYFTQLINSIKRVCEAYGVDYFNMLI